MEHFGYEKQIGEKGLIGKMCCYSDGRRKGGEMKNFPKEDVEELEKMIEERKEQLVDVYRKKTSQRNNVFARGGTFFATSDPGFPSSRKLT